MIVRKPEKKKKLSRYSMLSIIMIIIFAAITVKLLYLQVYKHDYYKEKANATAARFVSEKAPRGKIYDATGNILATNKQTYSVTYTTTEESNKKFFTTVDSIIKILQDNKETIKDDFLIKLDDNNKPYYNFKGNDKETRDAELLRFLRDRGFNDPLEKEYYQERKIDLTDAQIAEVNSKLLKITAEEAFYQLVKDYDIIQVLNPTKEELKEYNSKIDGKEKYTGRQLADKITKKYSLDTIRNYIVVKDALRMQGFKGYKTTTIAANIKKDTAFIIMQKLNTLPGIDVTLEPIRYYPYKQLGSSFLGYVSSIDSSQAEKYELRGYDVSSDLIGKQGIESAFEDQLKGVKGGTSVKVNSQGRVTEELFKLESYPGNNVHLSVDKNIQYVMEKALEDFITDTRKNGVYHGKTFPNATRGAAVALDANTGEVLGLASYPYFDPNLFTVPGQLSDEDYKKYFNPDYEEFYKEYVKKTGVKKSLDELFPKVDGYRQDIKDIYPKPFYNYATLGLVQPGSIFKPLSSVAGLESGVISPTETIYDGKYFNVHPETFGEGFAPQCHVVAYGNPSHGHVNVSQALAVSCNFFYYEVAYRMYKKNGGDIDALNSIAKYAWSFGLGADPNSKAPKTTGIEIEENFGNTYNFSSFKETASVFARFELRDKLESGNYNGIYYFVPFDYNENIDDNEELKNAKVSLKKKINDTLLKVGTKDERRDFENFASEIRGDVLKIMNTSPKYKKNVEKYEKENNKTVNKEDEATKICNAIAQFVINDKRSEITTPAEIVFDAIGQSTNQFTILQLANYIATLVNGGDRYKVHLVNKITNPDGNVVQEFQPEIVEHIDMKKSTVDAVKEGMRLVNHTTTGTAYGTFAGFPILTGGKTGTADFSNDQNDWGRDAFSTYVSFAPLDKPEIVVAVITYDTGGLGAAPVAKAVYEEYFKEELIKKGYSSPSFKKYVKTTPKDNKEK